MGTLGSGGGGKPMLNPRSLLMVVVTKKKVSNKNAMSAMEAFGISGVDLAID
jgi:hypothetical protein